MNKGKSWKIHLYNLTHLSEVSYKFDFYLKEPIKFIGPVSWILVLYKLSCLLIRNEISLQPLSEGNAFTWSSIETHLCSMVIGVNNIPEVAS
jgi:hypothetical protein